jgi:hypothetical protein
MGHPGVVRVFAENRQRQKKKQIPCGDDKQEKQRQQQRKLRVSLLRITMKPRCFGRDDKCLGVF